MDNQRAEAATIRSKLRYPSDLTDSEWALVAPLIPPAKRGGNKRTVDVREIVNGIMYVLGTGCQWAALPTDLPPRSTVNFYFCRWQHDRTLDRLHHALYVQCREQVGREASPTGRDHRQPKREKRRKGGCSDPNGYDAGKRIKGKKRHILVDTQGLLMLAMVHAADIQDRNGGVLLMASTLFGLFPFLLKLYADSGYQGPQFQLGLRQVCRKVDVEIVKRSDMAVCRPAQAMDRRTHYRLAEPIAEGWPRIGSA